MGQKARQELALAVEMFLQKCTLVVEEEDSERDRGNRDKGGEYEEKLETERISFVFQCVEEIHSPLLSNHLGPTEQLVADGNPEFARYLGVDGKYRAARVDALNAPGR
jgi:hypothetical protein